MPADDLPTWALDPRTPAWARAPKYFDALNPIDVIEIQRGGLPQRTIDKRLSGRRRNARLAQQRTEERSKETPEQRKAREQRKQDAQRLARRQSLVKLWENKIAEAESHPPGSMAAMVASFSLPSLRMHLAEAQQQLRAHVENALREELHKLQEGNGHEAL